MHQSSPAPAQGFDFENRRSSKRKHQDLILRILKEKEMFVVNTSTPAGAASQAR